MTLSQSVVVAETIVRVPRVREIRISVPMTYEINMCLCLAWCLTLIAYVKDWLIHCD